MNDPYLVLGIPQNSDVATARKSCERLKEALEKLDSPVDAKCKEMAWQASDAALNSIESGSAGGVAQLEPSGTASGKQGFNSRLRLGQLCLASGMISIDQLYDAMQEQQRAQERGEEGAQLGEILQAKQIISQEELDGLLMAQDLIDGEQECSDPEARRLLCMKVISEEAMTIALLEMRFASSSLAEVLERRQWLSRDAWSAIFS